jgi:hypothetical protein
MATKLRRVTTNLEKYRYEAILDEARREHRSVSQQVAFILDNYYLQKLKILKSNTSK